MSRYFCTFLFAMALAICFPGVVVADPIHGRDILKFSQKPMLDTVIPGDPIHYHGHDEFSTAYGVPDALGNVTLYVGNYMADDFADEFKTPVVHLKWWGSYLDRPAGDTRQVKQFLISFEKDVPLGDPNNIFDFSHPGDPLLNQIVSLDTDGVLTAGSGTFTEKEVWPVSVDGPIYEYNAELHLGKEFRQVPDTVRWLKIVALVDVVTPPVNGDIKWGWHNRDYTIHNPLASVPPGVVPGEFPDGVIGDPPIPIWHFQDDAVQGQLGVIIDPAMPNMPRVVQNELVYLPQNYEPLVDGPSIIALHSKDLAFELYTVPEPAAIMLAVVAFVVSGLSIRGRRT